MFTVYKVPKQYRFQKNKEVADVFESTYYAYSLKAITNVFIPQICSEGWFVSHIVRYKQHNKILVTYVKPKNI
jgi:hypothetical protein